MNFTVMIKKNHSIFSSLQLCTASASMQFCVAQHQIDGSIWKIPSQQESSIGNIHGSSRKFVSSGHRESIRMCKRSPFIDDATRNIKYFLDIFQVICVKVFSHFFEAFLSQETTKKSKVPLRNVDLRQTKEKEACNDDRLKTPQKSLYAIENVVMKFHSDTYLRWTNKIYPQISCRCFTQLNNNVTS